MMTEGWRNGQQVQPRSPDNLAEGVGQTSSWKCPTMTFLLFEPLPSAMFLLFANCKINSDVSLCQNSLIQITPLQLCHANTVKANVQIKNITWNLRSAEHLCSRR